MADDGSMLAELFIELCEPWSEACLLLSREGQIVAANQAGLRMLGANGQVLTGRSITDFVTEPAETVAQYLLSCSRNRQVIPGPLTCLGREGQEVKYRALGHRVLEWLVFVRCSPVQVVSSRFNVLNQQLEKQLSIQRQLKAERDLLGAIAQNIGAGLRIISRDYKTVWANSVIRDTFGDTIGKTCHITYSQQQDICPWCGVRQIFEDGKPSVTSEAMRYDKDGHPVFSEIVATALYDERGNITSALELVLSITKRKLAERRVQDDEKRAAALLKLSQLPWATKEELIGRAVDEAVRLTDSVVGYFFLMEENQQSIEMVAWSQGVHADCSAGTPVHYPLDKAGIWADCARLRRPVIHNDYPNFPGRKEFPTGHLPIVRHMSVPLLDNGAVVAIIGVGNKALPYDELDSRQLAKFMNGMWGIFKQKMMEREVLSIKEKWEMTFDAIDEVVTIHDLNMKIVQANKAAGRMLHVKPSELIGKYCFELFSGFTEPCPGCPEVLTRDTGAPHTGTIFHDKLQKTVEVSSFPLLEDGIMTGFVHIAKDVTEHKMLEAQLRQAQKMEAIGTLAGGIAHDFNNILVPILGYAELALDRISPTDAVAADLKEINQAAYRAKDLVKQILAFSRQAENERWPLELHLVIKEALKLLRASLPTTIEIRQKVATDCGAILGDPIQIHQLIMNLCTNAYHAMRDTGGVLGVSLVKLDIEESDRKVASLDLEPGPYVQLEVSDTGHGMDGRTLERIFEPYFTTKPKGEGTGMGLSVVHGIIKSYQGHIAVYSEPGVGTTFHIYLPRIQDKAAKSLSEATEPLPDGNERILIVDDEKTITSMLQMMLERRGYQLTTVNESPAALALFEKDPSAFDLLITDMTMPIFTGFDLARKVLAIRPEMPIILITGFSELINKEKANAAGIREFLMKPATSRDLAECVRRVLDGK